MVDNWKEEYENLIKYLNENLSLEVKKDVFFEVIFMTYSYIHRMINQDAFPNAINLYNPDIMTGRGRGKYMYKNYIREEGEIFFREKLKQYFPKNEIIYIVQINYKVDIYKQQYSSLVNKKNRNETVDSKYCKFM